MFAVRGPVNPVKRIANSRPSAASRKGSCGEYRGSLFDKRITSLGGVRFCSVFSFPRRGPSSLPRPLRGVTSASSLLDLALILEVVRRNVRPWNVKSVRLEAFFKVETLMLCITQLRETLPYFSRMILMLFAPHSN